MCTTFLEETPDVRDPGKSVYTPECIAFQSFRYRLCHDRLILCCLNHDRMMFVQLCSLCCYMFALCMCLHNFIGKLRVLIGNHLRRCDFIVLTVSVGCSRASTLRKDYHLIVSVCLCFISNPVILPDQWLLSKRKSLCLSWQCHILFQNNFEDCQISYKIYVSPRGIIVLN